MFAGNRNGRFADRVQTDDARTGGAVFIVARYLLQGLVEDLLPKSDIVHGQRSSTGDQVCRGGP